MAKGILLTFLVAPIWASFEVNEAAEIISEAADPDNIIFGLISMKAMIKYKLQLL